MTEHHENDRRTDDANGHSHDDHGGGGHHGGEGSNGRHDHHEDDASAVAFAVLTVSTSRTIEDDPSGDAIVSLLEADGHTVGERDLVADDRSAIRGWVERVVADDAVDAAITTGGTGLSPDDVTVPAVTALFDREIAGFGERFRALSADDVGPNAMLSDATAGLVDDVPVFSLPGSRSAVELGVSELVLPTVGHVLGLQRVGPGADTGGDDRDQGDTGGTDDDRAALTHVDESGEAGMVDVGAKAESRRRAVARGTLRLQPATVDAVRADAVDKGDVLATTRIGAIDAVKHTWETIPLCHQIPVTNIDTEIDVGEDRLQLTVAVETVGQTGCEMEAIQGVTTGLGVAWDMVKAAEKDDDGNYPDTRIEGVRVVEKTVRPVDEGEADEF